MLLTLVMLPKQKKTHDPITGALVRSAMKILPTAGASLLFLISPQAD